MSIPNPPLPADSLDLFPTNYALLYRRCYDQLEHIETFAGVN